MKRIILAIVLTGLTGCAKSNVERCEEVFVKLKAEYDACKVDTLGFLDPKICVYYKDNEKDCTEYWDSYEAVECVDGEMKNISEDKSCNIQLTDSSLK